MFTGISLGVVVAIIAVIALLGIIASGYVKAPPDTAYIISGLRKKIIIGKSSIKIPFLERLDKLSLKLIPIDVKTEAAVPTADYINIQVDAAVNVKVSSEPEKLKQAAENFLNQNTQYIAQVAREVLEGNMREIVGRMRLEEMVSDRQKFADLVKENAEPWVWTLSASMCRTLRIPMVSLMTLVSTTFPRSRKRQRLQRLRQKKKSR